MYYEPSQKTLDFNVLSAYSCAVLGFCYSFYGSQSALKGGVKSESIRTVEIIVNRVKSKANSNRGFERHSNIF